MFKLALNFIQTMRNLIYLSFLLILGSTALKAQDVDPDFARKIRPEYKLDLTPKPTELPAEHRKKTKAEAETELKSLQQRKANIQAELARLEAVNTPKQDDTYIKYTNALNRVNDQIAEREKYLTHPEYQNK